MGHKSYCKNRLHVSVIVLMLFPVVNLLNADIHHTEIDKLEAIECGKNSSCGLSEKSRYVVNTKNKTLLNDVINHVEGAIRSDNDLTNKGDVVLSPSTVSNDITEGFNDEANSENFKLSSAPIDDIIELSTISNDVADIKESKTSSNNDLPEELNDEVFNPDDIMESSTSNSHVADIKKSSTTPNNVIPEELNDPANNLQIILSSTSANNYVAEIIISSTPLSIGIMETSIPDNVDIPEVLINSRNLLSNKDIEYFSNTSSNNDDNIESNTSLDDDIPEELLLNYESFNTNIKLSNTPKNDNMVTESSTPKNDKVIMESRSTSNEVIMESSTTLNKNIMETSTTSNKNIMESSIRSTHMEIPIELKDEPNYYGNGLIEGEVPDVIEEETAEPTKDDFNTLLDYADYTTEKYYSDGARTSNKYFTGDRSHTIESKGYSPTFIQATTPVNEPYSISPFVFNHNKKGSYENQNTYESSSVRSAKADTSINSVYLKHLNASTAGNITQELLKKKLDFENIFDEEEKLNKTGKEADAVKAKSRHSRRKGSLAFVFDATGSMWDDLVQLRKGADLILETMLDREDKPIQNYVLVPFRDPGIQIKNIYF